MSTITANTTVTLDGSTTFTLGSDAYAWDDHFIFVVDAYVPTTEALRAVTFNLKGTDWNAEFLNFSGNNQTVITDATTGAGAVYIDFIGLFGAGPNTVTLKNAEIGVLKGGQAADTVSVGYFANSVILGRGKDSLSLTGTGEVSYVDMGRGDDTLSIGKGHAWAVDMGRGNDTVTVGAGGYSYGIIDLGRDADIVKFAANASHGEYINAGEGISEDLAGATDFDTLDFSAFTKALTIDLAEGGASAKGFWTEIRSFEKVIGGTGADKIFGSDDAETLDGRGGSDTLSGDTGKDIFAFSAKLGSTNIDTIDDFSVKDDTIWLYDDIFTKAGKAGDLAADAFYAGTKAHYASDRIIYDKASGKLWYDADGTGSAKAVQFALLDAGLSITANDFDIFA